MSGGGIHSDSGKPMPDEIRATDEIRYVRFATSTREVALRNTGVNSLWISLDRKKWFDVPSGTSWDGRVIVPGFWFCTQTDETWFALYALQLAPADMAVSAPTDEELAFTVEDV